MRGWKTWERGDEAKELKEKRRGEGREESSGREKKTRRAIVKV